MANNRLPNRAAPDAFYADPAPHGLAVFLDADSLQVGLPLAFGNTGRLAAVTPQVLCFPTLFFFMAR